MTDVQTTTPPPVSPPANAAPGVFGTKVPSSVVFAIAILLFLMPFVDIRCNNMSLQTVSGAQLATGFKIKAGGSNSLLGGLDKSDFGDSSGSKDNKREPNLYAMIALAAGVLAFLFSLLNGRGTAFGGIVLGALAAAAMIGLLIDIQQQVKGELVAEKDVTISVDLTPWFYITLLAFVAGAIFSYKRLKAK